MAKNLSASEYPNPLLSSTYVFEPLVVSAEVIGLVGNPETRYILIPRGDLGSSAHDCILVKRENWIAAGCPGWWRGMHYRQKLSGHTVGFKMWPQDGWYARSKAHITRKEVTKLDNSLLVTQDLRHRIFESLREHGHTGRLAAENWYLFERLEPLQWSLWKTSYLRLKFHLQFKAVLLWDRILRLSTFWKPRSSVVPSFLRWTATQAKRRSLFKESSL